MLLSLPDSEARGPSRATVKESLYQESQELGKRKSFGRTSPRRSPRKLDRHSLGSPSRKGGKPRKSAKGKERDVSMQHDSEEHGHPHHQDMTSHNTSKPKTASGSAPPTRKRVTAAPSKPAKKDPSLKQKSHTSSFMATISFTKAEPTQAKRNEQEAMEVEQEPEPLPPTMDDDPFLVPKASGPPAAKRRRLSPIAEQDRMPDQEVEDVEVAPSKPTTQGQTTKGGKVITKSIPTPKRKRQPTPPKVPEDDSDEDHIPLSTKRSQTGTKSRIFFARLEAPSSPPLQSMAEDMVVEDMSWPEPDTEPMEETKKLGKRSFQDLDGAEDEQVENLVTALGSDDYIPPPEVPADPPAETKPKKPRAKKAATKPKAAPKAKAGTTTKKRRKKTNENKVDDDEHAEAEEGEDDKVEIKAPKKKPRQPSSKSKPASKTSKADAKKKRPLPPLEPLPPSIINRPPQAVFADGHYESDADPLDFLS
ncbi:hypothetical protein FRC02_001629 [Tulasnella sp. 418]|nr:hypothetical protein FRC02_001629 [Tulasnella sp. 418]